MTLDIEEYLMAEMAKQIDKEFDKLMAFPKPHGTSFVRESISWKDIDNLDRAIRPRRDYQVTFRTECSPGQNPALYIDHLLQGVRDEVRRVLDDMFKKNAVYPGKVDQMTRELEQRDDRIAALEEELEELRLELEEQEDPDDGK